jgi:hypothetical protein
MACRHEQPIPLAAAKAQIGSALRQRDEADRFAFGIEHLDANPLHHKLPSMSTRKPSVVPSASAVVRTRFGHARTLADRLG